MQRIKTCDEHDDCTVITDGNWPDQPGSWRSHAHVDIPAEVRLSIDHPEAMHGKTKVKWRMPTLDEHTALGGTDETHKDLAAAAIKRIEDPKHPLTGKVDEVLAHRPSEEN